MRDEDEVQLSVDPFSISETVTDTEPEALRYLVRLLLNPIVGDVLSDVH